MKRVVMWSFIALGVARILLSAADAVLFPRRGS